MGRVLLGQSVGAFFYLQLVKNASKTKTTTRVFFNSSGHWWAPWWRRWMVGPMGGVGGGWWAPWVESPLFKVALLLRQL